MSFAQIGHFVGEMKTANAYFGRIRILGGEPTINPKFAEICALLHKELVTTGHVGVLEVITNGSNPEADIQFVKVPAGEARNRDELDGAIECWITASGQARLDAARAAQLPSREDVLFGRHVTPLPADHAPGAWETSE